MNNGKTRSSLMGIVAFYLLYISYQLFQGRNDPESTMSPVVTILFIIFFVCAAAGVLIYAFKLWKKSEKEEKEEQHASEDENAMK